MKRLQTILMWVLGISFIAIGLLKYVDFEEEMKSVFDRANYPRWFFYIVATVEFIGGVLLLMTASTSKRLGSILIAFVMLGAMGTRYLLREHYSHLILPGIIFLLAVLMSLNFERKKGHGKFTNL